MAINEISTFLSDLYETGGKYSSHEVIIFTKFHEDKTKIVDFSLMANFLKCAVFFSSDFIWNIQHVFIDT